MSVKLVELKNAGVRYRRRLGLFSYRDFWAIENVTMDIVQGETVGVVGGNGAGKSTLLKLLAGIVSPDKGEAIFAPKTRISLLSIGFGLFPELSGKENAILNGILLGLRRSEVERRLPSIIEFSELDEFMDQPVRQYSTGMRARLAFSVAMAADPDLILVDEILGVGDQSFAAKSSQAMRDKMRSNKTVVIVSHNTQVLKELCSRILWIHHGKMVAFGDADHIINEYHKAISMALDQQKEFNKLVQDELINTLTT